MASVARRVGVAICVAGALAGAPDVSRADGPPELAERVRVAIANGVKYLRQQENGQGNWETNQLGECTGGETCLAALALLTAGVKPDDPVLQRGLAYVRSIPPKDTYVVGLQTMVLAEAGVPQDRPVLQRNVEWLVANRRFEGQTFVGWGYNADFAVPDNSNTQYALLGLFAAHKAGVRVAPVVWRDVQHYYLSTQFEGGWTYRNPGRGSESLTMTTAGLGGLLMAGLVLTEQFETLQPDGSGGINCGTYRENQAVGDAIDWISREFSFRDRSPLYNAYGIERAGRMSGQRFFGGHDWYREGCAWLVSTQLDTGGWTLDRTPIASTGFALLFLAKSRAPILITKLAHGPPGKRGDDWNNDRNDVRHLVEYASEHLFKRKPLTWQAFSARGLPAGTEAELDTLTGELLTSPIVYFNGHFAPQFTPAEKTVLKRYLREGGFGLAEACCGHAGFDRGFRDLMTELFPDNPLVELPPEHPVWRVHAHVSPGVFKLYGLNLGCKTVLMYSPQDLSCSWESNRVEDGRTRQAFRLGANIIAYATGLEPPKPRLSEPPRLPDGRPERLPRGFLTVGQLRYQGDWQPAPRAMQHLMAWLRTSAHIDVGLKTEALRATRSDLLAHKLMYLHGKGAFTFPQEACAALRANLEDGGLILADACCGSRDFDTAFRAFAGQVFPETPLARIPLDDELFGADVNRTPLQRVRCRRLRPDGEVGPEFRSVAPYLEGIKVNGRWAVVYSRYDIGCALESTAPPSPDCLGHDHESALRLYGAAVLYALKR